jgi:steroid delta-isomerase-like uncharacterized protein
MSAEAHRALIQRTVDGFNAGDLNIVDTAFSADFVDHSRPFLEPGRAGLRAFSQTIGQAFAHFRVTLDDMIADGDKVVVRGHATGRHVGEFMGIPATGRVFTLNLIDINRIEDGQLAERWAVQDDLGMLQQLGVIAQPTAGETVPS